MLLMARLHACSVAFVQFSAVAALSRQRIAPLVRAKNVSDAVSAADIDAWMRTEAVQYGLRSGTPGQPLVLGLGLSAEAVMAVTLGGWVLAVIEFERPHKIKSTMFPIFTGSVRFMEDSVSTYAVPVLSQLCEMVTPKLNRKPKYDVLGNCELEYDAAVYVDGSPALISSLKHVVKAAEWMRVEHHNAHGTLGWISSPFYHRQMERAERTSMVLSYDGEGSDGALRIFIAREGSAVLEPYQVPRVRNSHGHTYRAVGSAIRELAWGAEPYGQTPPCIGASLMNSINHAAREKLAGTMMAYAALGTPRPEWVPGAMKLLATGMWFDELWPSPLANGSCSLLQVPMKIPDGRTTVCTYFSCLPGGDVAHEDVNVSRQMDRDLAATFQLAFEMSIVSLVRSAMADMKAQYAKGATSSPPPSSLVVTGGCGLNVKTNSALARELQLPTHVPSAPGDGGLAVGAAWRVSPPPPAQQNAQMTPFLGAPLARQGKLLDSRSLQKFAERWGGTRLNSMEWLAQALLGGAVVAVARGRAELGPRALGHRSLISGANYAEQKNRLNRLKSRQWYRPCSPIVRFEDLEQVFEAGPDLSFGAPYMSFAPPLQPWVADELPAISHLDNTARPNGVRQAGDPWMHSLLTVVRDAMQERYLNDVSKDSKHENPLCQMSGRNCTHAVGVLINTSLNPKGYPIIHDVLDVLFMFCHSSKELDFVLLEEEWIFERSDVVSRNLCL